MVRMVRGLVAATLTLATSVACGGEAAPGGETETTSVMPAEYTLRLDRSNRDPSNFQVRVGSSGLEIQTGPSGILYRSEDVATAGPYRVTATFTELAAPRGHREGFGLFFGGDGLDGPNQRYTYFLVRADGRFLIKTRAGSTTHDVSDGWIESEHVAAAGDGDVVNELTVEVGEELVRFFCNGSKVAEVPAVQVESHGIVGIRANHNLSLVVSGFSLDR